jgi:hypothetical protein
MRPPCDYLPQELRHEFLFASKHTLALSQIASTNYNNLLIVHALFFLFFEFTFLASFSIVFRLLQPISPLGRFFRNERVLL